MRHYLTVRTGSTPRLDDIYEAFKDYTLALVEKGGKQEDVVVDLSRSSKYFVAMAMGRETNGQLAKRFFELEQLKATVAYPFLLKVYEDYVADSLNVKEFAEIIDVVISYVFRRTICRIPTNSMNKTFASLASQVQHENYVESIKGRFLTLETYKRFPTDEEFLRFLCEEDLYHLQRAPYFFVQMENDSHKEPIKIGEYTIEHVMPQNEELSDEWQEMLGEEWADVQSRLLHTLGNLTLTAYNPELSDRSFLTKRDMVGGFKDSHLRLNADLAIAETWDEQAISARAKKLATQAINLWKRPSLPAETVTEYRTLFSQGHGFDWATAHEILEQIPPGKWTTYNSLAEAVGTHAQPMAAHLTTCKLCANAYRVLTWDGRIADGFGWPDPHDHRDPKAVLESEGVSFDSGVADPDSKLTIEDLLSLVEAEN